MKTTTKELVLTVIVSMLFAIVFAIVFFYATSAEVWYSGMHDAKCEKCLGEDTCSCHRRLVEQDRIQQEQFKRDAK